MQPQREARDRNVSIHARARRATFAGGRRRLDSGFQFTPAHDGRRAPGRCFGFDDCFNSRPRTTGDHARGATSCSTRVSIHARARRATRCVCATRRARRFQFTPAHDGRPASSALTSATASFNSRPRTTGDNQSLSARTPGHLFQFTPAHDGRLCTPFFLNTRSCFNSRPRTTGDGSAGTAPSAGGVSIHARARRATQHVRFVVALPAFQFTPAHDGRHAFTRIPQDLHAFQFTPAHDGRRLAFEATSLRSSFNSRPRTTGDLARVVDHDRGPVSIHARARRATALPGQVRGELLFQFTPAHDGRPRRVASATACDCFNSRPRTTGDFWASFPMPCSGFQFTPAHDGRLATKPHHTHSCQFQFTPAHDGRLPARRRHREPGCFNSRPRTTGDKRVRAASRPSKFQFTPAHDGRPSAVAVVSNSFLFQFTPAHDGRPRAIRVCIDATCFNSRPRTTGDS